MFSIHEAITVQEVLQSMVTGINNYLLYRPHVRDQDLHAILDKQLHFMIFEYNRLLAILGQGDSQQSGYPEPEGYHPHYGVNRIEHLRPSLTINQLSDKDIAFAMLGIHKSCAIQHIFAALECAEEVVRKALQQSAINSVEEAYEIWQYLNQRGYYQIPASEQEIKEIISSFKPSNMLQMRPPVPSGVQENVVQTKGV